VAGQSMTLLTMLLVLGACRRVEPYAGAFDVPVAAAVLQPEVGGPFEEPVGVIANGHGGQIVQLALKQARFLTDDPTVSFLRTHQLATGDARLLTSVAIRSTTTRAVTVWAGDAAEQTLLRVPWIVDCDVAAPDYAPCDDVTGDAPVEARAYLEVLSRPQSATLSGVGIKTGWTTTETWTVTSDGESWSVRGSRSGLQPHRALPNEEFVALDRRLEFLLDGPGEAGEAFQIKTRSGLSEHNVGGSPLAISLTPDQSLLALIVHMKSDDRPALRWYDPVNRALAGDVALPTGAWPHRMSWTEDGRLLVADRDLPAAYEVDPGALAPAETHALPWPALDVATLSNESGRRLYAVPMDGLSFWLFDRDTDAPLDVNESAAGAQGVQFTTPIQGIEAMHLPYLMTEFTDDQVRRTGRSVAISLWIGDVVFAHEETGCLVQDSLGPRTLIGGGGTGSTDVNTEFAGSIAPPVLETNGASNRHVIVNSCAGIAQTEGWEVRFDQALGAWTVDGSLSGLQRNLASENQRYLSDDGSVSFTIRGGASPSRDGFSFTFAINDGVARADGDIEGDGSRDVSVPVSGDPVYFFYRVGLPGPVGDHSGDGFYPIDVRPLLLVPGAGASEVGRVDPQEALIDVGWQ